MKKLYVPFLLLFILFGAKSGFAQNFSVEKDSVYKHGVKSDASIVSYNQIFNNTSSDINLAWEITVNFPSGWEAQVCDNQNCYPKGTTSADFLPFSSSSPAAFQVYAYPNDIDGEGTVKAYVYDKDGNYEDGITFTHYFTTLTSGIAENRPMEFVMYPSPVKEYLNIKFSSKGTHEIEVYNILGRMLLKKKVDNTDYMKLSFNALQNGMYVIMYRDERGKVTTKTISKD